MRFILLIIGSLFCNGIMANSAAEKTYYLVRHAEKAVDGTKNPPLTEVGKTRAQNVAKLLEDKGIKAIYSTNYQRTQQTAAPLAELLGIEVKSYDPSDLKAFADTLKESESSALVVGHSNTTPALTYFLSGVYQKDIDESQYSNLFKVEVKNGKGSVTNLLTEPTQVIPEKKTIRLDLSKFTEQKLTFDMKFKGKKVGSATHYLSRHSGKIILKETTLVPDFKIDDSIAVETHEKDLMPISLIKKGTMGGQETEINLQWSELAEVSSNLASGFSTMPRAIYKSQGKIEINNMMSAAVVERSSVIMGLHLFENYSESSFDWYSGYDNNISTIHLTKLGEEEVTVPAGSFKTAKVRLEGGAPSQDYYISLEDKPKIIKIEVLGMPWVYELTEAELK